MTRSVERVRPDLVVVGTLELSFGLSLLASDVAQVLFEHGDLAEQLEAVGFLEPFVGVAFDLEQAWPQRCSVHVAQLGASPVRSLFGIDQ